MVIIVTGTIGIGKTTVCEKVVNIARSSGYVCGGILTHKAPNESLVILDIQSGEKETLASSNSKYGGPRTVRYSFNPDGIDFGIRAIERGVSSDILFVDEIGHLELGGKGFVKSLELVKTEKVRNCVLVIRNQFLSAFLSQLGGKPLIFETTISTRDQLPQKIYSSLTSSLPAVSSKRSS